MGSIPDILFRGTREFTEYKREVKNLLQLINGALEQINNNLPLVNKEILKTSYREIEQKTPKQPENLNYAHIAGNHDFALAGLIDALRRLENTFKSKHNETLRYYSGHQEIRIEPIISNFVTKLNTDTLEEAVNNVSTLQTEIQNIPSIDTIES